MNTAIANVHLHMKVREVFILTKPWDTSLAVHTRLLAKWLLENGYNVYVSHCVIFMRPNSRKDRYVEDTFRENARFNGEGLMTEVAVQNGNDVGKLGYWTQQMCTDKPWVFDFVLTVRCGDECVFGGDGLLMMR